MIVAGIWRPQTKRKHKVHPRRQRRGQFGELLQGDGSVHDWFEGRGPKCTIVIFVDDATSKITAGKLVPAETTESYQQILAQHLKQYGRPRGLYVDKHSICRACRENSAHREWQTHFAGVLKQ